MTGVDDISGGRAELRLGLGVIEMASSSKSSSCIAADMMDVGPTRFQLL
jgi:hypothetical protein